MSNKVKTRLSNMRRIELRQLEERPAADTCFRGHDWHTPPGGYSISGVGSWQCKECFKLTHAESLAKRLAQRKAEGAPKKPLCPKGHDWHETGFFLADSTAVWICSVCRKDANSSRIKGDLWAVRKKLKRPEKATCPAGHLWYVSGFKLMVHGAWRCTLCKREYDRKRFFTKKMKEKLAMN